MTSFAIATITVADGTPFFTNDWLGVLKLGGTILSIIAPIVLGVWKVMQGPLSDTDRTLQTQIDGLGNRVDGIGTRTAQQDTLLAEITRRADRHDTEITYLREHYGKIATAVESLRDQSNVNKAEIIDLFQRRTQDMLAAVHELDKSVVRVQAVVEERDRLTRTIHGPAEP